MPLNLLGLAKSAHQLARIPAQVVRPVADRYNALLQIGFDTGTDPYGNAWAPLAEATLAKGRFPPPLTDTRAMRSQAVLVPMAGAGMELEEQVSYGVHHMSGNDNLPKRRYFPDSGLPAGWRRVLEDELHKQVVENFSDK
jgi:hypothetical protein